MDGFRFSLLTIYFNIIIGQIKLKSRSQLPLYQQHFKRAASSTNPTAYMGSYLCVIGRESFVTFSSDSVIFETRSPKSERFKPRKSIVPSSS